jgi:hypothetical protein
MVIREAEEARTISPPWSRHSAETGPDLSARPAVTYAYRIACRGRLTSACEWQRGYLGDPDKRWGRLIPGDLMICEGFAFPAELTAPEEATHGFHSKRQASVRSGW